MDVKKGNDSDWVTRERTRRIIGFIGGYLIQEGAISLADLDRGLEMQLRWSSNGRQVRLGEILIEMGLITRDQLERALALQAREEAQAIERTRGS